MSDFSIEFRTQVDRYRPRRFLYDVGSGCELTYGGLERRVDTLCDRLREMGMQEGSAVGLIVQNGPGFYVASLALQLMGCQVFVFHPDWTPAAVSRQAEELPCSAYIVSQELTDRIDPSLMKRLGPSVLLLDDATEHLEEALPCTLSRAVASNSCVHLATSGTTGLSKWVPKHFAEVRHNMQAWGRHLELRPEDSIHAALPLCTANGFYITYLMPFWSGSSILLDRRFSPLTAAGYLESIASCGSTVLSTVPTMLYLLNRVVSEEQREAFRRKSRVRFAICGTAPLDPVQKRSFESDFSVPVYFNYGITETLFISSQNRFCHDDRSAGLPLEGMDVEVGEDGELIVGGSTPFLPYFGGKTGGFTGEGRFETGDIGRIEDDRVYVTGRSKQIVIKGGFNIYPAEVDSFIIRESCVQDTFTFGVANEILGEQLVSTVVLSPGEEERGAVAHLLRTLKEQLPAYKVPTIRCVESIIKTATGKPIKEEMIRYLSEEKELSRTETS